MDRWSNKMSSSEVKHVYCPCFPEVFYETVARLKAEHYWKIEIQVSLSGNGVAVHLSWPGLESRGASHLRHQLLKLHETMAKGTLTFGPGGGASFCSE